MLCNGVTAEKNDDNIIRVPCKLEIEVAILETIDLQFVNTPTIPLSPPCSAGPGL